jgi:hypothetical protein
MAKLADKIPRHCPLKTVALFSLNAGAWVGSLSCWLVNCMPGTRTSPIFSPTGIAGRTELSAIKKKTAPARRRLLPRNRDDGRNWFCIFENFASETLTCHVTLTRLLKPKWAHRRYRQLEEREKLANRLQIGFAVPWPRNTELFIGGALLWSNKVENHYRGTWKTEMRKKTLTNWCE